MDDIIELANLVEDQEVCKTNEHSVMDVDDEFSESENESSGQELNENIVIEKVPHNNGHYQHKFKISRHHYKSIIGARGLMLKKLCNETKTVIKVSKKKKNVVIIGSIQKRIIHAKHRIDKLIEGSKNSEEKARFTHFISIPTNTIDIRDNFIKFKEKLLQNCNVEATGFHEGMFQKPEKLHLTVCMLHLIEDDDQQKAIDALDNCKNEIIDPILNESGPINVEFKGLKCMNNNPAKARILYMDVQEKTGCLQKMSDAISDYFIQQGLSRKEHDKVTLHLTVMNTFYLKKKKQSKGKKNFDATSFLKDHENTCLGTIKLSTLHLSKLTAKSPDGYFEATSKVEF